MGGIVGGMITILLLVAVVLLTMTLIRLRKRKQHTINSDQMQFLMLALTQPMVVSFMLIWLNVLIALHTVSSRRTVQSEITDHHDIDGISLNPVYDSKPSNLPNVIVGRSNDDFMLYHFHIRICHRMFMMRHLNI